MDQEVYLNNEINYYVSSERPSFKREIIETLFTNQFIQLQAAGLTPDQITETVIARVTNTSKPLLRPLAYKIESGDFKALLTEGLSEEPWHQGEDDEEVVHPIPRRWSLWKQTDPVALFEGKVRPGDASFAASYYHQVFVFESEENLNKFLQNPKIYLSKPPQMPKNFRLLIAGHQGCGKKTQANKLSFKYDWKVVDWKDLIQNRINELKQEYENEHLPNNPLAEDRKVGLSEQEWNDVQSGKPFDSSKIFPWFYQNMGLPLEKKRPPPVPPKDENAEVVEEVVKPPTPPQQLT